MCAIFVKLTTDNTPTVGSNCKELYDCKWDPMTLKNNVLYTPAFKFLQIFCPDDGLPRLKLVTNI